MAGDWIKMRVDLGDDPGVVLIANACDVSEDEVVGKLHRLWSWADRHTTDGTAPAINGRWVDRYVSQPGFADAMVAAGWLHFTETGVEFPNFERHNGESAKRRAENTLRQRLSRKNRDNGETGVTRQSLPRPFVRHVMQRDNWTCVYCGAESSEKQEGTRKAILGIDHIKPESRGGSSAVTNLATCCRLCNNEKNDRTPEEWGVSPKFLSPGLSYVGGEIVGAVSQKTRDKSGTREEKRREEEVGGKPPTTPTLGVEALTALGVQPQHAADWLKVRKEKRAPLTQTALDEVQAEAVKAGMSLDAAIRICAANNWQGFKAKWLHESRPAAAGPRNRQAELEQRNAAAVDEFVRQGQAHATP